jgi:2-methylcitrate dehydratase PrpD
MADGAALGRLLERLTATEWADLAAGPRRRAGVVLADDLAAAFSALEEAEVQAFHARLLRVPAAEGPPVASLLTAGLPRIASGQAALGNALAMGWNELDEGYRPVACHAGLYVLPALLAEAQASGASLRELLRALVLAYEVVARVADAWRFPALVIHPHALLAPIGAAAGVAFARRLPPNVVGAAVGTAASLGMAGPFTHATRGVLARNTWAAQAAQAGFNAVEWACCGIGGGADGIGAVLGGALGATYRAQALDQDGTGWAIENGYHKVHACCQYAHSAVEAVQALLAEQPLLLGGETVAAVDVEAHPLALALDDARPATTLGAKFSLPHAVAAALVLGHGGRDAFSGPSLRDERIAALRARVSLRPFDGLRAPPHDRPARVHVRTTAGAVHTAECWSARGGADRPLADGDLRAKWIELAAGHAPGFVRQADAWIAEAGGDGRGLGASVQSVLARCFAAGRGDDINDKE